MPARVCPRHLVQAVDHTPEQRALAEAAVERLPARPDAGETHLARAHIFIRPIAITPARSELDVVRRTLPNSSDSST